MNYYEVLGVPKTATLDLHSIIDLVEDAVDTDVNVISVGPTRRDKFERN